MADDFLLNPHGLQGGRELISFLVGDQEFCVDINTVVEIRGWTPATPMPHSADYVRGVINLRGVIMPIIDLGARLGFGVTEPSDRHVIIVAHILDRKVGLLVDAVCETLNISDDSVHPAPELGDASGRRFIVGFIPAEGRMITLLDLAPVLPESASAQAA